MRKRIVGVRLRIAKSRPSERDKSWVSLAIFREDLVDRGIDKNTPLLDIFHMPAILVVEFVEQGVRRSVEQERPDAEPFAERHIEGRRDLERFIADPQLHIAVIFEQVSLHELFEPRLIEVIAHVRESDSGRNSPGPQARRQ